MTMMWEEDAAGNGYYIDDGSDNIDVGGGWNPATGYNDSTAADNIDVGGGWNPATGTGDRATADAAAATGVTSSASLPAGVSASSLTPTQLLKKLFTTTDSSGNTSLNTGMLGLVGGGLGALLGANKTNTTPTGYQGKIPKLVATRQAPAPGQKLSGNVTFSPAPVQAAKGGSLQSGGFVIPADVVSHLGNGSSEAGLRLLSQRFGATPIKGKGDGMSDSIKTTIDGHQPARVANEEAHLTKEQVRAAGGAQKLYDMMAKIRKARTGNPNQGKQINPAKFMPGGTVQRFETGGGVTASAINAGVTGTESSLSNWAGDYVTNMLGKGQALSEMPYEQYSGPLTAGPSALQQKAFSGLEGTAFPTNLGQTFSSTTAPTIGAGGQPTGPTGVAASYMNPYLSAVLNPQLEEQRRQAQINNLAGLGSFTKSGAFGGGRQAIMESENARNLAQEQNKTIGQAYANAYDKGQQQFNTEQQQAKTLVDLLAQQGQTQRGIASEATAADKAQFEEARLNPYKMVQFQQSLLSGLPLAAQSYNVAQPSTLQQILAGVGGGAKLGGLTQSDLNSALKNLGII